MTSALNRPELRAGSPEPTDHAAVDELLSAVPELAFADEFNRCVPQLQAAPTDGHAAVDAHYDERSRAEVVEALTTIQRAALAASNGGLAFLVRSMLHFAVEQPVPPSQHPLFVALFLRGVARVHGMAETPAAVALQMDRWS
ncbi:MAG: hypothetical protein AAGA54_11205 [Myxococcota bacterium]